MLMKLKVKQQKSNAKFALNLKVSVSKKKKTKAKDEAEAGSWHLTDRLMSTIKRKKKINQHLNCFQHYIIIGTL